MAGLVPQPRGHGDKTLRNAGPSTWSPFSALRMRSRWLLNRSLSHVGNVVGGHDGGQILASSHAYVLCLPTGDVVVCAPTGVADER